MEKQNSVMFRSSPAGYNKRDVNQFILAMNANFSSAEEGYKKEISALKEECKRRTAESAAAVELKAERDHLAAEKEEALREMEALKLEMEELRRELALLRTEQEEAAAAQDEDPEVLEQLQKKATLYDTMSSQFGDVMLTANHNAERVVADARRDAEQSLAAAKSTIGQSAALLTARLNDLYRNANTHAVDEIQATVYAAQKALSRFFDDFSRRRAQLDEVLKRNDAEMRRAAEEQIAQMAEQGQAAVDALGSKKTCPAVRAEECGE